MEPAAIITGLIGLLGATWTALIAGFFRGDLVPGHVYRREIKRGDSATTQAERNAGSISDLAKAHSQERTDHARELAAKEAENADLRRRLGEAAHAPSG